MSRSQIVVNTEMNLRVSKMLKNILIIRANIRFSKILLHRVGFTKTSLGVGTERLQIRS